MIVWLHPKANINLVICITNAVVDGDEWVGNIFFQLFLRQQQKIFTCLQFKLCSLDFLDFELRKNLNRLLTSTVNECL
jgi:hypothetical protein